MQSNHSFAESRFPRLSFLRLTRNHGLLVCFCAQKNAQASPSSIGQICRAFEALVTLLQTRSNGLVDEGKHGHASRNLSAAPRLQGAHTMGYRGWAQTEGKKRSSPSIGPYSNVSSSV